MKITRYPLPPSQQFVLADFLADPDGFAADSVTAFEQLVEAAGFSPDISDVRVGALAAPFGEHLAGAAVVCRLDEERMVGRYFAVVDLLGSVAVGSVAGGDWQSHVVAPPCIAANSIPANSIHHDVLPANLTQLSPYPVQAA